MIILYICLGVFAFLLINVVIMLIYTFNIAKKVYFEYFVRDSKDKWGRECSALDNVEQVQMYDIGKDWAKNKKYNDVEINSQGFHLVGQFFKNTSKDTCVIIIPGRTESLIYSYYFSKPYYDYGYNVLVIDNRSHGLSEGTFDTLGFDEYQDIRNWIEFIKQTYGIKNVIIHGICIGSATSIYALTFGQGSKDIKALVGDGTYTTFTETMKNHFKTDKHPIFPVLNEVMYLFKKHTKVKNIKQGPIDYIDKVNVPMLFLYSKEDNFSRPYMANEIYEKCSSKQKKIVWFDHGAHSHIRINATEKYDKEIQVFLKENNL